MNTRGQIGQGAHGGVVLLAEILREEEVAVFLVVGCINLEGCELHAALRTDARGIGFLLRGHELQFQSAELHIGAQTEERRCAADERRVAGERHIAGLHEFYDFVFLAVVFEFDVLGVVVESGIGVVVEVHLHLVAHRAVHVQVDFLVEIDLCGLAVVHGERGVVDVFHRGTEFQLGRSLCTDAHTARTEDFFSRTKVEVQVGKVEFLLSLGLEYLVVFLAEIVAHELLLRPLEIFLLVEHEGGSEIGLPHLRAYDVRLQRVVVLRGVLHIFRPRQVGAVLLQVVEGDGLRALHLPFRIAQRVGHILVFNLEQQAAALFAVGRCHAAAGFLRCA